MAVERAAAEYRFDIWTTDSGLPQNTVRAILQTRDGYLWVATLDGLARFDGVRFTVFNKANSPGLPGNRITALYEDRDNALWVGLEDGAVARYHAGRFTAFGEQHGLPSEIIQSIAGDEEDNLWVVVGRTLLQGRDGRFRQVLPESARSLVGLGLLFGERQGIVWTTNQNGVQIYCRGDLTTIGWSNGLPSQRVNHLCADQHGTLWLATEDAGLVKLQEGKVIKVYTQRDGLPGNQIRVPAGHVSPAIACEDRKGNLWVNGVGPWLGRLKGGVFSAYPSAITLSSHPLPAVPGLPGSHITSLYEDSEGNLWIGTEGRGLIRAREQVVNVLSTGHGLQAANIYPVCEDSAGAVWLGTWERGLARIKAGVVTNFVMQDPYHLVTALYQDRSGLLWVGTYGGMLTFQNETPTTAGVPLELSRRAVSAICQDRAGTLWFGSQHRLFSYRNGEVSNFTNDLVGAFPSVIIEDRTGVLWIGSRSGLTRLVNGQFTTWTEREGLPSNHVRSLYEDGDGTLWIGTYDGGLGRFKEGRFTRYTTKEGMFDDGVFQILEDARGNFWMSSNRGIHRVSKRELNEFAGGLRRTITAISYGNSDGMLNVECNGGRWPSGVKTRDGKLWFPTQDGVAVIDPEAIPANPNPPPVVIESVLLDRSPVAAVPESTAEAPAQNSGAPTRRRYMNSPLRVPTGKSNIDIHYSALSFVNSERLQFKYRLKGWDHDWVEAGTRRVAYYSRVAPGHYTFNVLAANRDGVWNEDGASLAVVVLPAWYETWWFRALIVAALAGVAFAFFRARIVRLQQEQAAQHEFSRGLIESQEQERKRIAGELHDGLGQALLVIKNTASLASAPAAPAEEIRQDLAAIANLSGKALEDLRSISHALRPPELDRLGLTKALEHAVRLVADAAGLRCSARLEPLDGLLAQEAEIHLYRLVQECLNNIVKHARATFVEIRAWPADGYLRCSVRDNGEGFDPLGRHPSSEMRQGFGLAGMTERMRLLGGQIEIHSQPGSGTLVEARLPLQPKNRA